MHQRGSTSLTISTVQVQTYSRKAEWRGSGERGGGVGDGTVIAQSWLPVRYCIIQPHVKIVLPYVYRTRQINLVLLWRGRAGVQTADNPAKRTPGTVRTVQVQVARTVDRRPSYNTMIITNKVSSWGTK